MLSHRAAAAAVLLGLLAAPALGACSADQSATGSATTAPATGSAGGTGSGVVTTDPAHTPTNAAADLAVLDGVTVTGDDPATTPKVAIAAPPVKVSATTVKVLKPGTGAASAPGNRVTVRQVLLNGSSGAQIQSDWDTKDTPSFVLGGAETIPGLITALTGVQAGSRILFAVPPAEAFGTAGQSAVGIGANDDLLVVADVLGVVPVLTEATGTPVAPVAGLPTVAFDSTTGPTITVPKTAAPTTLVSQDLVVGTGAEVKAGQTIRVHYTGALWADGSVFDSSWTRKQPATFTIGTGQVIPGWDKTLVGQKVGSRVLLVVPPADGYGASAQAKIPANSTLVFVVDILDAY